MENFSLGERIMVYRKRANLTKKELAEKCDVSVSTITKYENDQIINPNITVLIDMSLALNVSVNKLLMGIEDPKKRMELEKLIKEK